MEDMIRIAVFGLLAFFIWSRFAPVKGVHTITTHQLREKLKKKNKKRQMIDVRTAPEFRANHIRGFKNIPLQQLSQQMNQLNKNEEVILICASGSRSRSASRLLKRNGFTNIVDVRGGMNQWV